MDKTNGFKNIGSGIIAQIITIGLGIVIPRLVLVNLGSEANGLLNSVGNILGYMTLLEAGVGTASLQALYKPIACDDKPSINHIISATHYFYKRTGYIYGALVVILSFVYTLAIKTELPKLDVFLVVLLSGMSGVLSYFFQGKYKILLSAEGKGYIQTNIATLFTIGVSISKIILLLNGFNVVALQIMYFCFNLIQMLAIVVYIRKKYKWLNLHVDPDFEAIYQRKAVLIHQISGLIFGNTDILILTFFASLKDVSVYSMYALIYGMIKWLVVVVYSSFDYALGQTFHDKPRFNRLFDVYELYTMAASTALFSITLVLIIPFMKLYTAGVTDVNYIDHKVALLFTVYYIMHYGRTGSGTVINIAQEFEGTKWRAVAEMAINIIASIVLVIKFGIYGVLGGTILALLYRTNDMIFYAARILERSPLVAYKRWGINIGLAIIVVALSSFINPCITNYLDWIAYAVAISIVVIPLFIVVNMIFEPVLREFGMTTLKDLFKKGI